MRHFLFTVFAILTILALPWIFAYFAGVPMATIYRGIER
jgi:hypothetical protein